MENELLSLLIETLVIGALVIVPFWKIHGRAGFPPALSLIVFVPTVGLLLSTLVLAFAPWKQIKEVK